MSELYERSTQNPSELRLSYLNAMETFEKMMVMVVLVIYE